MLELGAGKTKTGRLWTYVRDDRPAADPTPPTVCFRYSPNRKGLGPQRHLKRFRGILQAGAFAGFNALHGERVVEAACWAHVWRKFYDLTQAGDAPIAENALQRIGVLYAIEAKIRGQPPDHRRAVRQARASPVLAELKAWQQATQAKVSTKSELAAAIKCALARWAGLVRYIDDGRIEIDHNAAEGAIRTVALGRKNYLFAGSDAGGERAALLYSLIGTAKLNGLDPQAYLTTVLDRPGQSHRRTLALEPGQGGPRSRSIRRHEQTAAPAGERRGSHRRCRSDHHRYHRTCAVRYCRAL